MHESAALTHLNTVRLCVQYQIWRVGAYDLKSKMHSDTMKKERVRRRETWRRGCECCKYLFAKLHFEEWIISWRTEGAFTLIVTTSYGWHIHTNVFVTFHSHSAIQPAVLCLWSEVYRFCISGVRFLPGMYSNPVHQHPPHTSLCPHFVTSVSEHESLVA